MSRVFVPPGLVNVTVPLTGPRLPVVANTGGGTPPPNGGVTVRPEAEAAELPVAGAAWWAAWAD